MWFWYNFYARGHKRSRINPAIQILTAPHNSLDVRLFSLIPLPYMVYHNDTSLPPLPPTPEPDTSSSAFVTPPTLREHARTEKSLELPADKLIVKSLATEWQYVKFSKICDTNQELLGTPGSKTRKRARDRRDYLSKIQTEHPEKWLSILESFDLLENPFLPSTPLQSHQEEEATAYLPISKNVFSLPSARPTAAASALASESMAHRNLRQCKFRRSRVSFFHHFM